MNVTMHDLHRGFAAVHSMIEAGEDQVRVLKALEDLRIKALWALGERSKWGTGFLKRDPAKLDKEVETALSTLAKRCRT